MKDILLFFRNYESTLYFILGVGIFIYAFQFLRRWDLLRGSVFGLEKQTAFQGMNRAAVSIFIMVLMGFLVFVLATFGPDIEPAIVLALNNGSEENAGGEESSLLFDDLSPPDDPDQEATIVPTLSIDPEGCIHDVLEFIAPQNGETVSGVVELEGIVLVENMGFFKFEIAPSNQEIWITESAVRSVGAAGEFVISWDTTRYTPGSYTIQLVVSLSDGSFLDPCRIQINIAQEED